MSVFKKNLKKFKPTKTKNSKLKTNFIGGRSSADGLSRYCAVSPGKKLVKKLSRTKKKRSPTSYYEHVDRQDLWQDLQQEQKVDTSKDSSSSKHTTTANTTATLPPPCVSSPSPPPSPPPSSSLSVTSISSTFTYECLSNNEVTKLNVGKKIGLSNLNSSSFNDKIERMRKMSETIQWSGTVPVPITTVVEEEKNGANTETEEGNEAVEVGGNDCQTLKVKVVVVEETK